MLDEALKYDLLIFDCDGTIRKSASGRVVPSSPDDVAIIPQAEEFFNRLGTYRKRPRIALCSNQMGVGQRYAAEVWLADDLLPKSEGFEKWCREMVATRPTEIEMEAVMQATADAVGADEWVMCCYWPPSVAGKERPRPENPHPDTSSRDWYRHEVRWIEGGRKPNPEMLILCGYLLIPHLDRSHALMIGNSVEDEVAAANAGCNYMDAAAFWEMVSA